MILDDRHHSRRIWDVLLCRVRGPEDTSQDLPPQTDEFWFRFKHFKAMRFPWWQTHHGTNHESSPPWCNTAIWVEWNAVTHVTCPASSEQMIPSLRALVALDRDSCDTKNPKIWMVDVLWSLTSPGHELHFGPADLVHLSIRSFEFHLARLFYLKVRQKKIMTYTTSDCQPSRCFAPSLKRNCRKCIQRVLHPEN